MKTYIVCKKNVDGNLITKEISEKLFKFYLDAGWEEYVPEKPIKKEKKSKKLYVADEEE